MIRKIIGIVIIILSMYSAYGQQINVNITQENKKVAAEGDRYTLRKLPFTFQVEVSGTDAFLIGATTDDDVYRSAIGEADLEVEWFENSGMAEGRFNAEQSLFISNDAPSYWYFTAADDHRFDRDPKGTPDHWTANRTVAKIDLLALDKQVSLKDIQTPLYLVFYIATHDEDYNVVDKKILYKAELVWE
ncbi:hypothetical protein U0038_09560 [Sphingobacterium spiritivorum]|uniref:Uncharacterized protein n=1 Tax=Sphingobacterium spiritivorum ATCC 33861 TaxID=525373 RepID=D7VSZ0_SPHSI|nr:hypothetical protein [Sphingobacterium spiritivorum]EFK56891.1 hypothetical protein HMPREF0766_14094 [Sphingobacterium spiritivorum ATCC 33861]QQT35089.1 hypothetical protein I6J01_17610 [Sphingobacterium spiritivorum]WQD35991.1 hypothetical protein U0038_09560 [Sphingobacterium spiritivorum]SUJ03235.1 Uncharacterised protein [Sphingobacterium spiritivorum]